MIYKNVKISATDPKAILQTREVISALEVEIAQLEARFEASTGREVYNIGKKLRGRKAYLKALQHTHTINQHK